MLYSTYIRDQADILSNIPESDVEHFANGLRALRASKNTLWVAGNGGSASTASHTVADLTKTITGKGNAGLTAIALSELVSLQTAFANDESFEVAMSRTIELVGKQGDGLLIISVSGLSPNLLSAAKKAKSQGIQVFCLVGERGIALAEDSDYSVVVPSNDYQVVENLHLTLIHWFVKALE